MATRVHSSVGTFHLWNSLLLLQMVIEIDFSSIILFFRKWEIDFSQTNNLDNWPIYIAVMELKYQESQYLNHQMFGLLHRLHFFHTCLNITDFVLQITWSKVLIKTSVRTETLVPIGACIYENLHLNLYLLPLTLYLT